MTILPTTSLRDLAFIVCTALDNAGTTAVLSGGGAATSYSKEAYLSRDLDFVLSFGGTDSSRPLTDIGFTLTGQSYVHPNTTFTLDFPPGPLAVGSDLLTEWSTLEEADRILHIIKPTDSVLDRFAAYVHWHERVSLEIAARVAIAIGSDLDWNRIRTWCAGEGATKMINDLEREIAQLNG